MGFTEALLLAFIILKLTGVIAWSWWLVLAPLYPSVVIWVLIALFGVKFWKRHKKVRQEIATDLKSYNPSFDDGWPW
jgi:MFS superfamily sulfate permease-like transporter